MAITDYDSLLSEVQKWCARSDSVFANRFETWLTMVEDRLYDGAGDPNDPGDQLRSQPLRSKVMVTTGTITFALGAGTIPADMVEPRSLHPDDQTFGVEYLPPERFAVMQAALRGPLPQYFTVEGDTMRLVPTYTGTLNVTYFQRFPAISSNNKTGELLAAHPALYLSGLLFEAYTWMEEPETALGHLAKFRAQVAGANGTARSVRYGSQALRVRPRQPIS